jgi:ribosome biogenesis GTPase A
MTKAKRMIAEELKLIDIVIEMLDARIPAASSNPLLAELIGGKTRVIVLNKSDLSDPAITGEWLRYYTENGLPAVLLDSVRGQGVKKLTEVLKQAAAPISSKWLARGVKNKSIRVMIAGIPNVGKSSLINRFLKSAKAQTADRPGVTKGKQWLKVAGGNLEILDTPGILWPKFDNSRVAFALAATGAIKDAAFDVEQAALLLLEFLRDKYPDGFACRYKLPLPVLSAAEDILAAVARQKGCLRSGGTVDLEAAAKHVLTDFRAGLLGRVSLEAV